MEFHCSRCHERIQGPETGEPEQCPRCKAEAGLEPVKKTPRPMLLFAAFLGTAVLATLVSGIVTLVSS